MKDPVYILGVSGFYHDSAAALLRDGRVGGSDNHCLYGKDDDGKVCLVVSTDDSSSFTLNTPAATLYKVGWMNAKTGDWQYGSDIVNHSGGNISFTAPDTNDWILLLYDWDEVQL